MERGAGKLLQLHHARALGLRVPDTLATNDPRLADEFVAGRPCIYKTFGGSKGVFTSRVSTPLRGVELAPCMFQELIPKAMDIRAVVIGDRVLAVEIHSDPRGTDFRLDYSVPHAAHWLPVDVESRIIRLLARLGLVFGCADLILTPEGEYVFLEVNQQGQWLWLDGRVPGLRITDRVCEFLTA